MIMCDGRGFVLPATTVFFHTTIYDLAEKDLVENTTAKLVVLDYC